MDTKIMILKYRFTSAILKHGRPLKSSATQILEMSIGGLSVRGTLKLHTKHLTWFLFSFRQKREKVSFVNIITQDHLLSLSRKDLNIRLKKYHAEIEDLTAKDDSMSGDDDVIIENESSKYDGKLLHIYKFYGYSHGDLLYVTTYFDPHCNECTWSIVRGSAFK